MAAINQAHTEQAAAQRQQRRIMRLPEVKAATGFGRTKIYELMKEGRFPKARRIACSNASGWDSLEVEAWIDEQLDGEA
ncbi:helix-turn-helix transcriptional regulator [Azotobacter salinestris]|uniref:helix-turn-helix transcriptional regulator n=1 Tax=Azotobacter salinestris TaxID=69964 RepID=UPI001266A319|nr:AlpA family phage regulatory protein [Azotobacter salinestris]